MLLVGQINIQIQYLKQTNKQINGWMDAKIRFNGYTLSLSRGTRLETLGRVTNNNDSPTRNFCYIHSVQCNMYKVN